MVQDILSLTLDVGTCEPEEFQKAIEKIGVTIPSKKDLEMLFKYYDSDGSGALDYKEFSAILLGKEGNVMEKKNKEFGQGLGYKPVISTDSGSNINEILGKVKAKLASRGARGIIGMGKQFKIFDDDNSRSLDQYEFKKAMKEQMLNLTD
jgi:Ca2+-binding EF-hand superfamily protein